MNVPTPELVTQLVCWLNPQTLNQVIEELAAGDGKLKPEWMEVFEQVLKTYYQEEIKTDGR